jgi:hypothetical protein
MGWKAVQSTANHCKASLIYIYYWNRYIGQHLNHYRKLLSIPMRVLNIQLLIHKLDKQLTNNQQSTILWHVSVSRERTGKYVAVEIRFLDKPSLDAGRMFPRIRKLEVVNSWKPERFCEINIRCHGDVDSWRLTSYRMCFHVNGQATNIFHGYH